MRSRRLGVTSALVSVLTVVVVPPAAPATPVVAQPCSQFTAAPFTSERTAFCAGDTTDPNTQRSTGVVVFRTRDGGRTWARATAAGLVVRSDIWSDRLLLDLVASPRYADDHVLLLQLAGTGLFVSQDGGESFLPLDPLAGSGTLSTVTMAVNGLGPVGAAERTLVLHARRGDAEGANQSALLDPVTHLRTAVRGTPGADLAFAVSATYGRDALAFGVADHGVGLDQHVALYACNELFDCGNLRYRFPKRMTFDRVWLVPAANGRSQVVVSLFDVASRPTLWSSSDDGRTFRRWTAAETIIRAHSLPPHFGFAAGPPGTVFLRTTAATSDPDPPVDQIHRTTDGGRRWTLVSFGRAPHQRGPRGTMPVNVILGPSVAGTPRGMLTIPEPGRMFALGTTVPDRVRSFFCSADGGRTWRRAC